MSKVTEFMVNLGSQVTLPGACSGRNLLSEVMKGLLKVDHISKGRVTCSFLVYPSICNIYKGMHGGAVAAIAERVSIACARTLVAEEKPLFLGEHSISYLSAAPINAELIVDGSVMRSGRNLTVVSVEFRLKDSKKLVYTSQATLFNIAQSKL